MTPTDHLKSVHNRCVIEVLLAFFVLSLCFLEFSVGERGRSFDPEGGGGWQIWSGQIIYFHHGLSRKIYFQVNRGRNIYFQPTFLKKQKKVVRGFSRGDRTWLSLFCKTFCRLLARNIAYLVAEMFWYLFFQYLYI